LTQLNVKLTNKVFTRVNHIPVYDRISINTFPWNHSIFRTDDYFLRIHKLFFFLLLLLLWRIWTLIFYYFSLRILLLIFSYFRVSNVYCTCHFKTCVLQSDHQQSDYHGLISTIRPSCLIVRHKFWNGMMITLATLHNW
jgi:hypothetical protein